MRHEYITDIETWIHLRYAKREYIAHREIVTRMCLRYGDSRHEYIPYGCGEMDQICIRTKDTCRRRRRGWRGGGWRVGAPKAIAVLIACCTHIDRVMSHKWKRIECVMSHMWISHSQAIAALMVCAHMSCKWVILRVCYGKFVGESFRTYEWFFHRRLPHSSRALIWLSHVRCVEFCVDESWRTSYMHVWMSCPCVLLPWTLSFSL